MYRRLYHGRSNRKTAIPDLSVSEDPSDDKFVECAVAGKADIIISSDRHLLDLDGYRDIHVCNAGTFLKEKAE